MRDKILVNIINTNARLAIIYAIAKLKVDFIEVNHVNDLKFKYELFRAEIGIFVYEITYGNYSRDFGIIKDMVEQGIKVIIILEEYSIDAIDDAIRVGAYDVIVLPVDDRVFERKIKAVIDYNKLSHDEVKRLSEDTILMDEEILKTEVARAKRGNYQISMVIFEVSNLIDTEMDELIESLKAQFRETDMVYRYSKRTGLVLCPFTEKENIVEVENKIRNTFNNRISENRIVSKLDLFGISFPKDGDEVNVLIKKLTLGLQQSIRIGKMEGTLEKHNLSNYQKYHNMIRKKYE